ncbi:MAG: hypothetical protein R3345_11065 [Fulvivirga sp.]|nr:hypothetical protein [Fulvivirga sp.]
MTMTQFIFFVFGLMLASYSPVAGQDNYEVAIKKQFDEIQKIGATDSEVFDPEVIVKHTYPPLIALMGGKEKYIEVILSAMALEEEEEEEYFEVDEEEGPWTLKESKKLLGEISNVYIQNNELQAVVEVQEIDIYGDRKEILKTYQLAISRDGGDFWYFIDGTMNWDKIVPDLHPAIEQPEEKEETVYN